MNIFEELQKLDLPTDQYMVMGSGILGALGIREIRDIDLLITKELFEKLKNSGWDYQVIEIEGRPRQMISKDFAEAYDDFWWKGGTLSPEEGIKIVTKVNGINFLPLKTLAEVKKAMAREKDIADVVLIEDYIKKL